MNANPERDMNQAAYRQLREYIARTYSPSEFIAVARGEIVANAESFRALDEELTKRGFHSPNVLVVQAGVDYSQEVSIFI